MSEQSIWTKLKSLGLSDAGVAGFMGNMEKESNLCSYHIQGDLNSSNNYQTSKTYTTKVDSGAISEYDFIYNGPGGGGYGLCQWTYQPRKKALYTFAKQKGKSIGDEEMQCEFILNELPSYTNLLAFLKSTTDVNTAASRICKEFELPSYQNISARQTAAWTYYNKYKGTSSSNNGTVTATTTSTTTTSTTTKEKTLRQNFVNAAKSYIGCKESDGSHKPIIDLYNSISGISYKMSYTDPWCAAFVSAVAQKCGLTSIIYPSSYCDGMIALYKAKGRWKEDDSYTPQIGDLIMYDWQDSGSGDNTGSADHVGIVCEVNGSTMKIIEGNVSDAVGYRAMTVNGKFIRGYCLPNYASVSSSSSASSVVLGNYPVYIRKFQTWLNQNYHTELVVDGSFGNLTKKAAIMALQEYINNTYNLSLEVDGVAGVMTRTAFTRCELIYGCKNDAVYILQGLLYCKGYNPNGFDGIFGAGCKNTVKNYQSINGLMQDGIVGRNTWISLVS